MIKAPAVAPRRQKANQPLFEHTYIHGGVKVTRVGRQSTPHAKHADFKYWPLHTIGKGCQQKLVQLLHCTPGHIGAEFALNFEWQTLGRRRLSASEPGLQATRGSGGERSKTQTLRYASALYMHPFACMYIQYSEDRIIIPFYKLQVPLNRVEPLPLKYI